ncbi:MAG TPA: YaiO family outer membrane beta-barrel protein [Saprospiraceae bacterium]|nr:YaiO family outer membrane beta-barrel protein [Saprospiraceae bacterium]
MRKILFFLWIVIGFLSQASYVYAQKINYDSIFQLVIEKTRKNELDSALTIIQKLVMDQPDNQDYSIYLTRIYYWQQKYTLALETISKWGDIESYTEEMIDIAFRVNLANKDPIAAFALSNIGLENHERQRYKYRFLGAQSLEIQDKNIEALEWLDEIPSNSEFYVDAQYLKTNILRKRSHQMSTGWLYTFFDEELQDPWLFYHAEYLKKFRSNAIAGRITRGSIGNIIGHLFEVDMYPRLTEKSYLYINAGFSGEKTIFPSFKLGGELYYGHKKISASLGIRHLSFSEFSINMFTGHVGIPMGYYFIEYRPFLFTQDGTWFPSHVLNFRKFASNRESFVQLDLQYGTIPFSYFITDEFSRVASYRAGIQCKLRIASHFFIHPFFMYEREEFNPNQFRNRYNLQFILSKRF